MGELFPQLPDSEPAGAGSGGASRGGRAPGPSAAPPGSAASARGVPRGPYLPSSRAHMGRCCCGSGWWGAEARPSGPSPSFHRLVPGAPRQRRLYSRPLTRYFRRREFPGSPTPRPHSAPPHRFAPALTPGSAPPRGGGGGGCGYLRALPAGSPEPAPRPPGLESPQPSCAGARRPGLRTTPVAVPLGGKFEALIPTQHGGGVRGGFPRRRRLRGREEKARLHTESRPTAPLLTLRTLQPPTRLRREMKLGAQIPPPTPLSFPFHRLSVVRRALWLCLFLWGRTGLSYFGWLFASQYYASSPIAVDSKTSAQLHEPGVRY